MQPYPITTQPITTPVIILKPTSYTFAPVAPATVATTVVTSKPIIPPESVNVLFNKQNQNAPEKVTIVPQQAVLNTIINNVAVSEKQIQALVYIKQATTAGEVGRETSEEYYETSEAADGLPSEETEDQEDYLGVETKSRAARVTKEKTAHLSRATVGRLVEMKPDVKMSSLGQSSLGSGPSSTFQSTVGHLVTSTTGLKPSTLLTSTSEIVKKTMAAENESQNQEILDVTSVTINNPVIVGQTIIESAEPEPKTEAKTWNEVRTSDTYKYEPLVTVETGETAKLLFSSVEPVSSDVSSDIARSIGTVAPPDSDSVQEVMIKPIGNIGVAVGSSEPFLVALSEHEQPNAGFNTVEQTEGGRLIVEEAVATSKQQREDTEPKIAMDLTTTGLVDLVTSAAYVEQVPMANGSMESFVSIATVELMVSSILDF